MRGIALATAAHGASITPADFARETDDAMVPGLTKLAPQEDCFAVTRIDGDFDFLREWGVRFGTNDDSKALLHRMAPFRQAEELGSVGFESVIAVWVVVDPHEVMRASRNHKGSVLVEVSGVEPLAFAMPLQRSTN